MNSDYEFVLRQSLGRTVKIDPTLVEVFCRIGLFRCNMLWWTGKKMLSWKRNVIGNLMNAAICTTSICKRRTTFLLFSMICNDIILAVAVNSTGERSSCLAIKLCFRVDSPSYSVLLLFIIYYYQLSVLVVKISTTHGEQRRSC